MVIALCGSQAFAWSKKIDFDMVRSGAAVGAGCLPNARGHVVVKSFGPVEVMKVNVFGLPPHTHFDFFVIQQPDGPFGMSWYEGDIDTDDEGHGYGLFIGRFSIETFIVAPAGPSGGIAAPTPHDDRDATTNPATPPVHTFHLGLWFNSPDDAVEAGCPGATTPFNGDHTAGVQALSTRNFPALEGPLGNLQP
ncbi:MAG: hypothetical protein JO356_20260 [Acidobacteria bacterium]|nr:hypothetical protein [Acidobacteriota bacterium]